MVRGLLVKKTFARSTVVVRMEDVMSAVLFVLVVWMLASVPFALCIGRLCSLHQLSLDDDAAHIAPGRTAQTVGNETRTAAPSSALLSAMRI